MTFSLKNIMKYYLKREYIKNKMKKNNEKIKLQDYIQKHNDVKISE